MDCDSVVLSGTFLLKHPVLASFPSQSHFSMPLPVITSHINYLALKSLSHDLLLGNQSEGNGSYYSFIH